MLTMGLLRFVGGFFCLLLLFGCVCLVLGSLCSGLVVGLPLGDPGLVDEELDFSVEGDPLFSDLGGRDRGHLVQRLLGHLFLRLVDPRLRLVQELAQR